MEAELKLQRRPRMRSIMARTPFERCGGRRCSRPSARKAPCLPRPNGRERWPRYLATSVERAHLRSFHRWRDRRTVWGSSTLSLVGLPNGLQLFHELVWVGLGFLPCCKRIERCVSHLHVLGNAPSIAARLPGVLCDIDCEDMDLFHTPVMRRRRLHGLGPAHCGSDQALRTLESARASRVTCLSFQSKLAIGRTTHRVSSISFQSPSAR